MMGLGGVDQQIQERVDAYRGNPQQLMQRYQQNQQLIDLLALQKLKSEKDAAAREMQMKMQTTPQTIKDQREAEMLQRTKDELVQQTTGIMQQRQRQQQQNMQRTANQGLPQLPAGNMQKMAGGGIVSFAEGGPSRQEDADAEINRKIELALQMGASVEQIAEKLKDNPRALSMLRSKTGGGMSVPSRAPTIDVTDIASLLGPKETVSPDRPPTIRLPEREPSEPSMGQAPAKSMSVPSRAPMIDVTNLASLLGPKETIRPEKPEVPDTIVQDKIASMKSKLSPSLGSIDTSKLVRDMGVTPLSEKPDGIAGEAQQRGYMSPRLNSEAGIVTAPLARSPRKEDPSGVFRQMQESAAKTPGGPIAELARGNKQLAEQAQVKKELDQLQEIDTSKIPSKIDQLQEIDTSGLAGLRKQNLRPEDIPTDTDLTINQLKKALAEQNNPEKLRRERLRNFLLGAAGGTSISSALAGAGARSSAVGKAQEQARLKGIEQLANMQGAKLKNEVEARSAKALEDIRASQNETQRFSALATAAQSNTESLQALMLTDEKYLKAEQQLKEAEDGGWFGVDEDEVRKARLALNAELQRLKSSIQGYDFVSNAYQAMLQKFQGATSAAEPTSGVNDSQFKVQQISK